MTVTERDIQRWLYWAHRSAYAVLLPNYTPRLWHECDVFGVTRAGYFNEFEIKLSVADFKADREKQTQWIRRDGDAPLWGPPVRKHERLAASCTDGPSRFWYVTPRKLVEVDDVPEWAGLIWFSGNRNLYDKTDDRYGREAVVKQAPKLHSQKINRVVLRHALNCCYYRFWDERIRVWELSRSAVSVGR